MSEFQYYEFQAIDRPLDATEQGELRKFSSRAAITSRRFTNEYHWGSFKGDTVEWMKRYFDAHVHLSDFGSRAVHFRLPNALVDREAVRLYQVNHVLEVASTTTHHVISFHSNEECGADPDCFDDDPSAVLGDLLPARELLATGDLRPEAEELYRQQQEKAAREAAARQMERERQEREARQRHLESLRGSEARLWNSVVSLTETSVASDYDHAVKTLLDLRDLAATNGETSGFQHKLEGLRGLRRRKSGLLRRLDAAGLV